MKTFLKTGVYLCLVCPHFFAVSNPITSIDPQELERLFQPIHQSVRDKAYRENNYSIKRATYFSKRHRIVEADLDLLAEKSGPFLLNPFEDVELVVEADNIRDQHSGTTLVWVGKKLSGRIDTEDSRLSKELKKQLNSVNLYIHAESVENEGGDFSQPAISPDLSKPSVSNVIYVTGEISHFNSRYQILPADNSFKKYLIIELDRQKRLISGSSEEAQRRRDAHMEFERRLLEEEEERKARQTSIKED